MKNTVQRNYSVLKANHTSHHIMHAEEMAELQQVGRCTWHSDAYLNFIWTIQMLQFYNTKLWILLFSSEAFEVLLHEVYKHPFLFRMKKHQPIYWSTEERIKLCNSEVNLSVSAIILSSICCPSIYPFIYLCS